MQRLDAELKQALISRDQVRVDVLKMLKSAVNLEQKEKQDYDQSDFIATVRKQIKMRTDAIELYMQAGRDDHAKKETAEVAVLEEFLPKQLTEPELLAVIQEVAKTNDIAFEKQNMGRLIGLVVGKVGESASKADIAKAINSRLN
ncbi:GatB/YqeY domain-containing protein [Candidatus Saccharibacteria bacterium]|nr:GatB/YqeY domain-containing protein [Candidatus Saccharibacteria bacterium]MCB9821295.1 GatB/YqeY domain-containing protein [Candidatus Nomurabacteria bacterium]